MIKKVLKFGILLTLLIGILLPISSVYAVGYSTDQKGCEAGGGRWGVVPNTNGAYGCFGGTEDPNPQTQEQVNQTSAQIQNSNVGQNTQSSNSFLGTATDWLITPLFKTIGTLLMSISALVLTVVGTFFDTVMNYTVVDMAKNLGSTGLGNSITQSWATLRDIANMFFIFVLLFAAFRAMFELSFGNIQTTIRNIIIVAILINFSLFASKVVIDASNIVATGFYKSITTSNYNLQRQGVSEQNAVTTITNPMSGIAGGYMRLLGMQGWFSSAVLDSNMGAAQILTVGVMSSVFFLVTAVILLITAFMFVARYILLIFAMILSALAAVAYIIPGQQGNFEKWKKMLIDQSVFAPVFFALTWVVFRLATAPGFLGDTLAQASKDTAFVKLVTEAPDKGVLGLVLNYVLVMGMAIAALVIAKNVASKTAEFNTITGGVATAGVGALAWGGRQTLGRMSAAASQSSTLRNLASSGKYGTQLLGRAGLWTAGKGAEGSFDVRSIDTIGKIGSIGDSMKILGKGGGKGGFLKAVEEKAKSKAEYSKKMYGQTDGEKDEASRLKDIYEKGDNKKNYDKAVLAETTLVKNIEKEALENKNKVEEELNKAKKARSEKALTETEKDVLDKEIERIEKELETKTQEHTLAIEKKKAIIEDKNYSAATKVLGEKVEADKKAWEKIKNAGDERQKEFANRIENGIPSILATGTGALGATVGSMFGPSGTIIGAGLGTGIGTITGNNLPDKYKKMTYWAGNQAAAKKIRSQIKEEPKDKKLSKLFKEMMDEDEKKNKKEPEPEKSGEAK